MLRASLLWRQSANFRALDSTLKFEVLLSAKISDSPRRASPCHAFRAGKQLASACNHEIHSIRVGR